MKNQKWLLALLFLFVFTIAMPMKADAAWKVKNGKTYYYDAQKKKVKGWMRLHGRRYYFNEKGEMQTGWRKIGKHYYYFSKKKKTHGAMQTGWKTIKRKNYYFAKNGRLQTGWVTIGKKTYYITKQTGRVNGKVTIEGQQYIFVKGVVQKRWITYKGNRYYGLKKTGELFTGVRSVANVKYYFGSDGVLQKNTSVTINGQQYNVNSSGVCTAVVESVGTNEDMLFFTRYESGSDGYAQTGGDNGNACGKYQFDRRHSLIPLLQYCYSNNPTVFAKFKKYSTWTNTPLYQNKLKNNQELYSAWKSIYNAYPTVFRDYQDAYAIKMYYSETERKLMSWGIDISNRPYVVKGAVFSYSIQHGSYTAAEEIRDAGVTNATSNRDFIKKIYKHRIKQYGTYKSRYTTEMNDALSRL